MTKADVDIFVKKMQQGTFASHEFDIWGRKHFYLVPHLENVVLIVCVVVSEETAFII